MRKFFLGVVIVVLIFLFTELCGWVGLKVMEKRYYCNGGRLEQTILTSKIDKIDYLRGILKGDKNYTTKYTAAYNLNYIPTPDFKTDSRQHNEHGYRGELIQCKKNDAYRILFLGGSTTYGSMVKSPAETYPAQTRLILLDSIENDSWLQQKFRTIEIINAGMESALSCDELNLYLYKFRYYKPDLVVIHSGGNDAQVSWKDNAYVPDYTHCRNPQMFQIKPTPFPKWLMNSYFISFLTISLYYPLDGGSFEITSANVEPIYAQSWYPEEYKLSIEKGNYEFYPFYVNFNILTDLILKDGAKVVVIPFALNLNTPYPLDKTYVQNVRLNNAVMQQVTTEKKMNWVNYQYTMIDSAYWVDDCNLLARGEKLKALIVAKEIFSILKSQAIK